MGDSDPSALLKLVQAQIAKVWACLSPVSHCVLMTVVPHLQGAIQEAQQLLHQLSEAINDMKEGAAVKPSAWITRERK